MNGYVYSISSPSNKRYIGVTKRNPLLRFQEHKNATLTGNRKIHKAMRSYGFENMRFEVIEIVQSNNESELFQLLWERERHYIQIYDAIQNGYNCTEGGEGTPGLCGELNPFYGRNHSQRTLKILSEKAKKRRHSEETKRKIAEASTGKYHSAESKRKMKERSIEELGKSVICLDDKQVFRSVTECADYYGISRSDIRKVCTGERISAHNKTFRFVVNGVIQEVTPPINKRVRRIYCFENNKTYESIKECCEDLGVKNQHVSAVLRGKQKQTMGYTFKYL